MSEIIPIRIPQETVNDDQVLIQQWQVVDGQAVREGQVLVEVETSKSVFEITCPASGFIRLNAVSNQAVHEGQVLVEVETSKSVFEIICPAAGFIRLNAVSNQEVPIGQVLCYVGASLEMVDASLRIALAPANGVLAQAASRVETHGSAKSPVVAHAQRNGTVTAPPVNEVTPLAQTTRLSQRALALIQTHGLSPTDFAQRGLVRGEDVLRSLGGINGDRSALVRETVVAPLVPPTPPSAFRSATGVPFRAEPLARSKRVETKLLSWSTQQAIRSSVTVLVPTAGRHELQEADADAPEKITAHIIRSTALLLREYPRLNACCLDEQVRLYEPVHIGYALDAGHGLKVAVLRHAEQRTLPELIEDRQRLITAYLTQSLLPADLSGATFTITDLSGSGVTAFDPLISEGQAGILGISGEFSLGHGQKAFHLMLSFDHRLVEGRAAATFLSQLKDLIVQFERSLISVQANNVLETCCSRCGITWTQATTRNHYLVSVAGPQSGETHVCTICLQGR